MLWVRGGFADKRTNAHCTGKKNKEMAQCPKRGIARACLRGTQNLQFAATLYAVVRGTSSAGTWKVCWDVCRRLTFDIR